jgi:hypothetical protein
MVQGGVVAEPEVAPEPVDDAGILTWGWDAHGQTKPGIRRTKAVSWLF